MDTVMIVFRTKAQMSFRLVMACQVHRVHKTGGSVETLQEFWLAPALEKNMQHHDLRQHRLEKSEHPPH
jgi:hypothetical protein